EPRAVTKHATSPRSPTFTPDGTGIYFLAPDPPSAEDRERTRLRDDVFAFDENTRPRHLWKVILSTGSETQITTGEAAVLDYWLSQDGTRIAFKRAPTTLEGDTYRSEVWVMDADGKNQRGITHNSVEEDAPQFSPDNRQLLFIARMNDAFEPYYPDSVFVVPATGGAPKRILQDFKYTIDDAVWSAGGKTVVAFAHNGVQTEVVQIDVGSRPVRQ